MKWGPGQVASGPKTQLLINIWRMISPITVEWPRRIWILLTDIRPHHPNHVWTVWIITGMDFTVLQSLYLLKFFLFHLLSPDINMLVSEQSGRHLADDIFKCSFMNENYWIFNENSLKFVLMGVIENKSALVHAGNGLAPTRRGQ